MELTAKQIEILGVIEEAVATHGYPPTVREIGEVVGLSSPASVHKHLGTLEAAGYIKRGSSKRRALELVHRNASSRVIKERQGAPLCLVGRVAAGQPLLAEENIEGWFHVPEVLSSAGDSFALRVTGTSMVKAGILDGDIVVVRQQRNAEDGEIVVAMVGEEATVKRFFRESDRIRLQPENDDMEPIFAREAVIVGKVTGVLRRL